MAENPGTYKVEDLLKNVHGGSYVIPYFQRGFEWQPSMVCDLIESILQNYYAGLILLWELNPEEAQNEEWDPIWGAKLKVTPDKAIPDGQQIAYVAASDIGSNIGGGDIAKAEMAKRRIWIVNISDIKKLQFKQLTRDQTYRDEFPIWSKDGKYILFARIDTDDIASLWLIPEEGGEPQKVVEELTLASEWFGFYGYTNWNDYFDWWTR